MNCKQMNYLSRESNIELLRIVSMILVLIVHASFKALGSPSKEFLLSNPSSTFLRCLTESISIVCVNSFVLISGWFGIRPQISRLLELLFQVAFFGLLVQYYFLIFEIPLPGRVGSYWNTLLFSGELWFVRAYIILWIFSPLLNAFVENSDKSQLKAFLVLFYVVQTLIAHKVEYFSQGYSPLSFMGLYLLSRYLRKYPSKMTSYSLFSYLLIYIFSVILITMVAIFAIYTQILKMDTIYAYSSPLVIVSSLAFFLFFSKLSFTSRVVNWVSLSAFSIYLIHCNPLVFKPIYLTRIRDWYSLDLWTFLYHVVLLFFLIAIVSIAFDKIRIFLWKLSCKLIIKYGLVR